MPPLTRSVIVSHTSFRLRGVEAGSGLVQEEDGDVGDERPGQVEAPPHTAGIGLHRPVAGVGQAELLEKFVRTFLGQRPAEPVQATDHVEVLVAGEVLVDGRELARQPEFRPHLGRPLGDVEARHQCGAGVGGDQGRQNPDRGGLAGTVGPQESQDGAFRDGQIQPVQCSDLAVDLYEPACLRLRRPRGDIMQSRADNAVDFPQPAEAVRRATTPVGQCSCAPCGCGCACVDGLGEPNRIRLPSGSIRTPSRCPQSVSCGGERRRQPRSIRPRARRRRRPRYKPSPGRPPADRPAASRGGSRRRHEPRTRNRHLRTRAF